MKGNGLDGELAGKQTYDTANQNDQHQRNTANDSMGDRAGSGT